MTIFKISKFEPLSICSKAIPDPQTNTVLCTPIHEFMQEIRNNVLIIVFTGTINLSLQYYLKPLLALNQYCKCRSAVTGDKLQGRSFRKTHKFGIESTTCYLFVFRTVGLSYCLDCLSLQGTHSDVVNGLHRFADEGEHVGKIFVHCAHGSAGINKDLWKKGSFD